jgi:hypothetical protein
MDKLIDRIAYLKKAVEKAEFNKSIPDWKWEMMAVELEFLNTKLRRELS